MTNWKDVKAKANLDPARVEKAKADLLAQIRRYQQLEEWEEEYYSTKDHDD